MTGQLRSSIPQKLRLAVAQSRSLATTSATLSALETQAHHAARSGIHLILFPEAYLGGYPRTCTFGASVGSRTDHGREQFLRYFHSAIDFGDTPAGSGDEWVEKRLRVGKGKDYRGDGTREVLERIARETGVFLVVGAVERAGGSLYCAVVYICPKEGCLGKRRKVMPTGSERLIWAQGSPSTLRAVTTTIAGVNLTLAAAICWENYMPLLRFSLYSQNVNLYLAPTADARETWVPLMQTIACEGRCFVLSANQCMRRKNLPDWIKGAEATGSSEPKPAEAAADAPRKQARRSSIITRTEDNHEISWPSTTTSASKDYFPTTSGDSKDANTNDAPQKIPRRASVITRTEDNHEITWPSADPNSPTSPATATSHITNGFFPSPLRASAIPNDDPATPSQQPISHQNTTPRNLTTTNSDTSADDPEEFVSRGGSVIVSPTGSILAGPLWDVEDGGMLVVSVDFQDCERGRLDLDVAGSYSRQDAFKLEVVGLDINPPP